MPDHRVIVDHAPADLELARVLAASLSVAGAVPVLAERGSPVPGGAAAPVTVLHLFANRSARPAADRGAAQLDQGWDILLVLIDEAAQPASMSAFPRIELRSWHDLGQYCQAVLQLLTLLGLRPSGAPGPLAEWWVRNHDTLAAERKRVTELFYLTDVAIKNSHWASPDAPFRWAEKEIDDEHLTFVHQLRDLAQAGPAPDGRLEILRESATQIIGSYKATRGPEARLRYLRTAAGQIIAVLDELESEMLTAFLSTVGAA
jgi:hypothetical protein